MSDLGPAMDTFACGPGRPSATWRWTPGTPCQFAEHPPPCSASCPAGAWRRSSRPPGRVPGRRWRWSQLRHLAAPSPAPTPGAGARAGLPGDVRHVRARHPRGRGGRGGDCGRTLDAVERARPPVPRGRLPELRRGGEADASGFFDAEYGRACARPRPPTTPATCSRATTTSRGVAEAAQAECCGDLAARPEAEQTPSGSTPTPRGRTSTGQGSVADELCRRAPEKDPPSGPSHASQARSGQSPRPPRRAGGRGRR